MLLLHLLLVCTEAGIPAARLQQSVRWLCLYRRLIRIRLLCLLNPRCRCQTSQDRSDSSESRAWRRWEGGGAAAAAATAAACTSLSSLLLPQLLPLPTCMQPSLRLSQLACLVPLHHTPGHAVHEPRLHPGAQSNGSARPSDSTHCCTHTHPLLPPGHAAVQEPRLCLPDGDCGARQADGLHN